MTAVIASEWLKLRRKGMLVALLATVAIGTMSTAITITTAGGSRGDARGPGGGGISVASLPSSHGLARALANSSTLLGVIALCIFAASFAGEYGHGTLRNLLVNEPRRVRLLCGKFVAVASAALLAIVAASAVGAIAAAVAAGAKGFDASAWWTAEGIRDALVSTGNLALATVGWGLFGAVLGVVFRSSVAAVGVGVAYALPLESILGGVASGTARWLPGKLLAAIAAGGDSTASLRAGLITVGIYATIASVIVGVVFVRRDVAV